VGADDRYEWRKVGTVVVVRPKRAWDDPSSPFNRPIRNVQLANATSSGVLIAIRDFIYTNTFAIDPRLRGIQVSLGVQYGTVMFSTN
jgi:hypothetical protein